jgi:hypothetical protein
VVARVLNSLFMGMYGHKCDALDVCGESWSGDESRKKTTLASIFTRPEVGLVIEVRFGERLPAVGHLRHATKPVVIEEGE